MREIGDYRAAESNFRDALAIRKRALTAPHVDIIESLRLVAVSLSDQERLDEALEFLQEAQGMFAQIPESDADLDDQLRNNIANTYSSQDRPEEAEPLYRRILKDRYARYGEHHLLTGFAHDNLAMALEDLERLDEAEQHYRKALEILLVVFGDNHPEVAQTMGNVGQFLASRGAYDEAERLLLKAIEIHRGTIGNDYFMVADSLTTLSDMSLTRGDKNTALDYIKQALVIYDKTLPAEHSKVLFGGAVLAEVLIALGRLDEAERQLLELYGSTELESQPGNNEQVLENLVALYAARNQADKADEYRQLLAAKSDSDQQ
jgi:tetratricopeptide (TPR) repeat protein